MLAKSKLADVVEEAATLSSSQLDTLLEKVVALRLQKRRLVLPKPEADLLRIINRGLTPGKRRRYHVLRDKLRDEALSESENSELLSLSDELEWLGVGRLRALMELAAIRKTTVPKLMKQLGIGPVECLDLNRPALINLRGLLVMAGLHPLKRTE